MSFLKSVLFGTEGSYNILGIDVVFEKRNDLSYNPYICSPNESGIFSIFKKAIGTICETCTNSSVFPVLTQAYTHILVHEMGHALVCKALTNQNPKVNIFTNLCAGTTTYRDPGSLNDSIISISGPIVNMAFSGCKLIGAVTLREYLSTPIAITIGTGVAMHMAGELAYAFVSAVNNDAGDFGKLARTSSTHLALASTALIGECALCVFTAYKLL